MIRNLELEYDRYSKLYMNMFNKYSHKKFYIRKPIESKWGNFFIKTVNMFALRPEWNAGNFLRANFEENGLIYPPQLMTEKAWNTFLDYRHKFESQETSLEDGVKATLEKITKYENMDSFIKGNAHFLRNKNFSYYALLFSRTFIVWAKENNLLDDLTPEKIKVKRLMVRKNLELYNLVKQTLKEDFI